MPRTQRAEDLLIALAVTVSLAAEILTSSATGGSALLGLLVLCPVGLALAVRRRHPLVPLAVITIAYAISGFWLTDIMDYSTTLPPALLAGYSLGRYAADLRPGLVAAGLVVVLTNLGAQEQNLDNWIFPCVAIGSAILTGRSLRTRALLAAELAERTERLAVEQDLRAAEAAVQERRRIARELHDVVAHTLSVMVVQAGAARRTLARDAPRAEQALETVEATGRSALGELRRMLGFVGDAPSGAHAPLDPQPTTADLAGLVRRAGAAGLATELIVEGEPGTLPAGEEVAVYRIVQEALTNALKHAGADARATVTLRWSPDAVEVEIRDRGGAGGGALPAGGHGLVGMRERVVLFGGAFEAAPAADGDGFRVVARLPRAVAAVAA